MSTLRIELFYDEEAGNWHFRVPALRINGGGAGSRAEAEEEARAAIAFALEGDPGEFDATAEALTLEVRVEPAA